MNKGRAPVIVGVGQINDRPGQDETGMNSVELMAAAARKADEDAGKGFLKHCDWLGIVQQISFRDLDPLELLPAALDIAPKTVVYPVPASGDTPIQLLNDAANAIARGEARVCLVTGGEAVRTAVRRPAAPQGSAGLFEADKTASEIRRRYGLLNPSEIYPLYENATRAQWGQTFAESQAESGEIWSLMSKVAAGSEGAWIKSQKSAAEIIETNADNRPIAFPYTKLMVANSSVNQGAAFIVTSLENARAASVPEDRLVYVWAGAAAHELDEPLERTAWGLVPEGMRVSLQQALSANGLKSGDLDHVELYSCFPCVPKMARRVLDWPADKPVTVHGGLTFGGGPICNYMSHAVAAMVSALRERGRFGLLFGNGGHCTHNHSIVLGREPPPAERLGRSYDFQADADAAREPIPPLRDDYEGEVTVESYTVVYDRAGAPAFGVVLARSPKGTRVAAKVAREDVRSIGVLTGSEMEPVGTKGTTAKSGDTLYWSAT